MFFKKPIHPTDKDGIHFLAPIPLYHKTIDNDILIDSLFELGLDVLNPRQQRMGQELPNQYDTERYQYDNFPQKESQWVEDDNQMPIGSRFFTPPNDFLNRTDKCVLKAREYIFNAYIELLKSIGESSEKLYPRITESWLQYYEPTAGRGHNQHNHSRWSRDEKFKQPFSGGLYLSDGEPLPDHPYSGVFAFHSRDMQYMVKPKKGLLMIWPSDIVHSVKPFYGKSKRAVINFNICLNESTPLL
jgi:hypothetical protein